MLNGKMKDAAQIARDQKIAMETEMYRKIMNDRQKEEMVSINMSQVN